MLKKLLIILLLLYPTLGVTASSIDETVPVQGAAVLSAPIRANFAAAKDEIEDLQGKTTGWISASDPDYVDINTAVTACVNTTLVIGEAETITGSSITLTVPAGCHIEVTGSGSINDGDNNNLTFTAGSSFHAPLGHQVFIGFDTDDVTGLKEAYPDYWGENTTPGTTDMSAEVQSAFNSILASNGTFKTLPVTYYMGTTQVFLGPTASGEHKVSIEMPPGSLIKCNIAGDYCVKLQNLGYSNFEVRVMQDSVTGHGIFLGNNGAFNSIGNNLHVWVGKSSEPTLPKPTLGYGTFGVTVGAPSPGNSNYYNKISGWAQNFDTAIYMPYGANANRVDNFTAYGYWYGVQVSSAQNSITNIFGTNAEGNIGGISFTFVDADVNVSTETIHKVAHGLIDGDEIKLSTTGTLPSPLTITNRLFVQKVDDDNFKLSLWKSTSASYTVNIYTAAGGGTHTLQQQFYSDLIHLGNGTQAADNNNIFIGAEPGGESSPSGTHARTVFGEMQSQRNIIFAGNNTYNNIAGAYNLHINNLIIDHNNSSSNSGFYDMSVNNTLDINGLFLQRDSSQIPNGGFIAEETVYEMHTLAGAASSTTAMNIPLGVVITAVSLRVVEAVSATAGDGTWSANFTTGAYTEIVFTPNGGNFNGGKIEIVVYYTYLDSLKHAL